MGHLGRCAYPGFRPELMIAMMMIVMHCPWLWTIVGITAPLTSSADRNSLSEAGISFTFRPV